MPLNRAAETHLPTLAEFGLIEASIADARAIVDRVNLRCGMFIFGFGAVIVLSFFLGIHASNGNVGAAVVGAVLFGGASASIAGIILGLLLLPILPRVLPQYARGKHILQRFEEFHHALKAFETEQRRKQTDYWLSLSPINFEKEVAGLLTRFGLYAVVTPASGDKGIDIRAQSGGTRAIVQLSLIHI